MSEYGNDPTVLGIIEAPTDEMMFWLYCPIRLPNSKNVVLPPTLEQYGDFVSDCLMNCNYEEKYVYLTAKTMHVTPENMGNRPGWHCDGFKTDDVNFIWSDCAPTEFLRLENLIDLPDNCEDSYELMAEAEKATGSIVSVYPEMSLLLLDESVIHRVSTVPYLGTRTFLKLSVSDNKYNLIGNSINHGLKYDWQFKERLINRNHPAQ